MLKGMAEQLMQAAHAASSRLNRKRAGLERRKNELLEELREVQFQLDLTAGSAERLKEFPALLRAQSDLCPDCWIERSQKVALRPTPSEDENDIFKCPSCKGEFVIRP